MAEDSQADYVNVPSRKKRSWATPAQKVLFLLMGLNMLGFVAERWLIYNLYDKMEVSSLHMSHRVQNLSNQLQHQAPQRAFAHLIGPMKPVVENNTNVLQWRHRGGEAVTYNMGYNNSRLLVNMDGYYYVYCKVTINTAENCLLIQHKVMKETQAYSKPTELMKSKSFRCPKSSSEMTTEVGEDLWNSFLAGIFQLQSGDEIFVTMEDIHKIRPGTTENVMGAFMISP